MKNHLWKVFAFSGWFILLVAIIFGILFASLSFSTEIYGSILLVIVGAIFIVIGEFLIEKETHPKYNLVWQAMSIAGAFSLTIGIIWIILQFVTIYQSWTSIVVLLSVGIGLVIVGESVKIQKK